MVIFCLLGQLGCLFSLLIFFFLVYWHGVIRVDVFIDARG